LQHKTKKMKKIIFICCILFMSISQSNAQITILSPTTETYKVVYKNQVSDYDPMYESEGSDIDLNLCINEDGIYYLRAQESFFYSGKIFQGISPKYSTNKVVSKFFLSNDKEQAIASIKQIISEVSKLDKNQYIRIKDYEGIPFIFSFLKNKKITRVIDKRIPLINGLGKDFDSFAFEWDIKYLQSAVDNADKWE